MVLLTVLENLHDNYIITKSKVKVTLKYNNNNKPLIKDFVWFGKPLKSELYVEASKLKKISKQYNYFIISTIKGVLFSKDAIKKNLGGKLLFYIVLN